MCVFEYEYANVMGLYGAEKEREGKGEPGFGFCLFIYLFIYLCRN